MFLSHLQNVRRSARAISHPIPLETDRSHSRGITLYLKNASGCRIQLEGLRQIGPSDVIGGVMMVGPHLMIVSPNQNDFQGINRDPSNGMPYAAHLPHHTEFYLVMPVRQWNE